MSKPTITAYVKTHCGWSEASAPSSASMTCLTEEKDIIKNPALRWEMEQKSGQPLSPCVEINGVMLADISGEEVERYMIANNLLEKSDAEPGRPDRLRLHGCAARGHGCGCCWQCALHCVTHRSTASFWS